MSLNGVAFFFLPLSSYGQSPGDSSSVNFWGAVTPTTAQPATPQQIQQLVSWLQQQTVADRLPCPKTAFWLRNPQPHTWIKPFAAYLASSSRSCNQQVLNELKRHIGRAGDARLVMWWILQANFHNAYNEYRTAEAAARKALHLADSLDVFQGWANLALARSTTAQEKDFPATYAIIYHVLELSRQTHDQELEMQALSLLGNINRRIYFGASLKAIPYHQAALSIAQNLRDTVQIGGELMALMLNYGDARRLDRHVSYMLQLTKVLTKHDLPRLRARIYLLAVHLLEKQSQLDSQRLLQTALRYSELTGETAHQESILNRLYDFYTSKGQFSKAQSLLPRLDSIHEVMSRHLSFAASTDLRHYAERKRAGDKAGALAFLEKEYASVAQRFQYTNSANLAQWEAVFQTREKDILLKEQEQQQRYLISIIGLITLLLVTASLAFYYQLRHQRAISGQMAIIETQAKQLQRVDQMKTDFFTNVSHELRTPLTLIMGPLGSVLKRQQTEAEDTRLLQTAQRNARQLLRLVNEILDLSKLEASKVTLSLQPVRLVNLIQLMMANFESHAQVRGIALELDHQPEEALTLELDVEKVRKVLENLLANAFKATQAGGRITLSVQTSYDKLLLWVSDTGRGIHPDDLPHVFDRYFQTNRPDAAAEGGTGIGLALCQEYARAMQGRLWVESQWGQGSTFFLELPRQEAPAEAVVIEPEPEDEMAYAPQANIPLMSPSPTPGETVLVVEDNHSLREYLLVILQPRFTVLLAENGQEALQQLAQADSLPSLIISDVMMPLMDGFQLLAQLKGSDVYRLIPVIMLTARADKADKLRALRIGVDDYLLKPFEEDELLARITSLLTNQRERRRHALSEADASAEVEEAPTPTISADDLAWLAKLEAVTLEQLTNADLTAEGLADDMAVSRRTLFREVKRLTGLTPAQYITEARFQRARQLLESREVSSVKQLASMVGFRQVKHFSMGYKNQFGKSPSDYL